MLTLKDMKISAQLYTLRNVMTNNEEISIGLKKVKAMGYETVQLSGIPNVDVQFFKDECDKNKLTICATHIGFDRLENELDKVIEEHKILGCQNIGIGCMPSEYWGSEEGIKEFCEKVNKIDKALELAGFNLFYHNHRFEFEKFNGKLGMDILFDETNVDFMLDTFWLVAGGVDPLEWIEKIKGRGTQIHLKDYAIAKNEMKIVEIGRGNINFSKIIEKCLEVGIDNLIVEQDDCDGDPFDSIKISIDYTKDLLKG